MKRLLSITAAALLASVAVVHAADDQNTTGKAMDDHPGTTGGATAVPTAKPASGDIAKKQSSEQPAAQTGTTNDPNAKPADGSISNKEMKDAPGAQK